MIVTFGIHVFLSNPEVRQMAGNSMFMPLMALWMHWVLAHTRRLTDVYAIPKEIGIEGEQEAELAASAQTDLKQMRSHDGLLEVMEHGASSKGPLKGMPSQDDLLKVMEPRASSQMLDVLQGVECGSSSEIGAPGSAAEHVFKGVQSEAGSHSLKRLPSQVLSEPGSHHGKRLRFKQRSSSPIL